MHEAARKKPAKPKPEAGARPLRVAAGGGGERLSAFYASGPAVPLAAPGAKKHVAVAQEKPMAMGRPGDRWEREADSVADRVTGGRQAPEVSRMPAGALGAQRQEEGAEAQEAAQAPEATRPPGGPAAQMAEDAPEAQRQEDRGSVQEREAEKGGAQAKEAGAEVQEAAAGTGPRRQAPAAQAKTERPEAQAKEEEGGAQEKEAGKAQERKEQGAAQAQAEEGGVQEREEVGAAQAREEGKAAQARQEEGEAQAREEKPGVQAREEKPGVQAQEEGEAQAREEGKAQAQEEEPGAQAQAEGEAQERAEPRATAQAMSAGGGAAGSAGQARAPEVQQAAAAAAGSRPDKGEVAARAIGARGAGEPLAPPVRGRLEAGMGVDLQGVRVHADGNAQSASRAMHAKAFTHGSHIFLGPGQSQHDVGLMAHEATHVLQQGGVGRRKPAGDGGPPRRESPPPAAASAAPAEEGVGGAVPRVGGPAEGVGGAVPRVGGPAEGVGGAVPRVGGPAERVGGAVPRVGGPAERVGGAVPRVGGPAERVGGAVPRVGGPAEGVGGAVAPVAAPPTAVGAPAPPSEVPPAPAGAPPATQGAPPSPPGASKEPPGPPPKPEPRAAAPAEAGAAAAPARGNGAAPAPAAAPAGPAAPAPAAAAGPGPAVPHPFAEAAAAARLAADRQRMAGVKTRLGREAFRQKGPAATRPRQRATSSAASTAASEAAPTPANEPVSRGEAVHTGALEATEKERGKVQPPTFLALVNQKLDAMKTPQTMEQMDDFKDKGGAGDLKEEISGGVGKEVGKADGKLRGTLEAGPVPEPPRVATPLGPIPKTPHSARLGAPGAAPAPRAEEEVTLEPSREKIEADLAEHRLTKERLEKANDPRFSALQKSRESVHEHADRAPAQFRREEAGSLAKGRRDLQGDEARAGAGMRGAHGVAQGTTRVHQAVAMTQESLERQKIAAEIETRYKSVESKVRGKLEWLAGKDGEEGEVDRLFNDGEKKARDAFESHVDSEIKAWKRRRYGGRASIPLIGGLVAAGTWAYDKLAGIDDKVQKYFDAGRALYLAGLRGTIETIASTVETALGWCNDRIAEGKKDIQGYIDTKLPKHLKAYGKKTAAAVFERFDELREEVDATREELADRLADRYKESQEAIDERIKEMQAENRGLVERFVEKLKEIIEAIRNFKRKIGPILAEAGDVIDEILDDPIGFLGNLLEAIGRGFSQFKARIDEHLKKGVIAWLFGNLATAGLKLPTEFSLKAMGGLVLDVLGLSLEKLKARAARMVGPRAMGVIEKVADYLGTLYREGPAGLWAEIEEDVGNLKDQILEEVKSWVITRIVTAAVKKLAMMFNPVGAIIQAILTIYDVVMFFLENIERILELVRTIVRAAADVVRGKIQAAADKIETAMGMIVPLILSFLARLLGLGGIAEKVRSVIARFKSKIDKAVTKFLRKVVAKFKKVARKAAAKGKAAVQKLVEWWKVRQKFKAGKKVHTLFFSGDRLKVASTERTVADLVEEHRKLRVSGDAAGEGADKEKDLGSLYRQTLTLAKAAEDMKKRDSRAARKKAGGEGLTAAEKKVFDDLKEKLKQLLKDLDAKSERPVSKIEYRGAQNGVGKHSEAVALSIKRPAEGMGTPASAEGPVWEAVRKRSVGKGTYYERGHLISQDFFGSGSKPQNIVPIWRTTNQEYEQDVEQPIKRKIWDEGETVRVDAHAKFGGRQDAERKTWLADLANLYPDEGHRQVAKEIIEGEMKLPDQLEVSAWTLTTEGDKVKGQKQQFLAEKPVKPVFPAGPPELGDVERQKPSLSRSDYRTLNGLGIAQEFARLITRVADPNDPPETFAEFEERIWDFVRQDRSELPKYLLLRPDLESWTRNSLAKVKPLVPGTVDL